MFPDTRCLNWIITFNQFARPEQELKALWLIETPGVFPSVGMFGVAMEGVNH
jgi:hypothetical protein